MLESPVVRRLREEENFSRTRARIKGGWQVGLSNIARDLREHKISKIEADERRRELYHLAVQHGWRVVVINGAIKLIEPD